MVAEGSLEYEICSGAFWWYRYDYCCHMKPRKFEYIVTTVCIRSVLTTGLNFLQILSNNPLFYTQRMRVLPLNPRYVFRCWRGRWTEKMESSSKRINPAYSIFNYTTILMREDFISRGCICCWEKGNTRARKARGILGLKGFVREEPCAGKQKWILCRGIQIFLPPSTETSIVWYK